jgi:hypothetical protein
VLYVGEGVEVIGEIEALDLNATIVPSPFNAGRKLSALASVPSLATLARQVTTPAHST